MTDLGPDGIWLKGPGQTAPTSDFKEAQARLLRHGVGLWPYDLSGLPAELQAIRLAERPTEAQLQTLKSALLFDRATLLKHIRASGRVENVPGGGALESQVENHGYGYPQLFICEVGIDYSRFDTYHVNVAEDGTEVDEVIQILSGSGLKVFHRVEEGEIKFTLACPDPNQGWILTYSGGHPHMASLATAAVGTKALVQVIGPPTWTMRNVD